MVDVRATGACHRRNVFVVNADVKDNATTEGVHENTSISCINGRELVFDGFIRNLCRATTKQRSEATEHEQVEYVQARFGGIHTWYLFEQTGIFLVNPNSIRDQEGNALVRMSAALSRAMAVKCQRHILSGTKQSQELCLRPPLVLKSGQYMVSLWQSVTTPCLLSIPLANNRPALPVVQHRGVQGPDRGLSKALRWLPFWLANPACGD
jgi:predicted phosphodiesterase